VLAFGAFLEFLFAPGADSLLDFADHKANLLDEGDNRLSSTSLATVGKAIAGILKNSEATKKQGRESFGSDLDAESAVENCRKTGAGGKMGDQQGCCKYSLDRGSGWIQRWRLQLSGHFKIIKGTGLAGETYNSAYDETDNELLGVKELKEEDLKMIVAEKLT
jgi:hypothetical protein